MRTNYDNSRIVDDVIDSIKGRLFPEEVFDVDQLEKWALDNGFIKESADE